jgi:hypothetical protein
MSLLRWTSKSTRHLADALVQKGFKVSDDSVGRILKSLGSATACRRRRRRRRGRHIPTGTPSSPT